MRQLVVAGVSSKGSVVSKSPPDYRFGPSAETLAAAKTRLPLRLPLPEETGPHRSVRRLDDGADVTPRPQDDLSRRRFLPEFSSGLESPAAVGGLSDADVILQDQAARYQPTDAQLEAYAQQALYRTGVLSFSRLWVEVRQQRAVLFGTLQGDFELPLALQAVRRVNGIQQVEHRIRFQSSQPGEHVVPSAQPGGKRRSVSVWLTWAVMWVLSGWFGWRVQMLKAVSDAANQEFDEEA
jgi:hypothetical protein